MDVSPLVINVINTPRWVQSLIVSLGIKYEDIAYGVANGFATVGTNNGHNGTYGDTFYQNDDVVIDFAWRS